ncbi:MAG: long-chain fatty acid--CoA ligase [Beijerinckiaceae bacterium]|nr:MAG: long-chain fatty acid--CoA ligase [Beijerinckiaceae bacterium]
MTGLSTSLPWLLDQAAAATPDRPCLSFLGRTYSYAEVAGLAARVAKGLQKLGVCKGERVGLCLPNSPYFVACYFGALKAGATVVAFNPLYTEDEIRALIVDSGTVVMITLDLQVLYPKVAAALHSTKLRIAVVCPLSDAMPLSKGLLFRVLKRGSIAPVRYSPAVLPFNSLVSNGDEPEPVTIDADSDPAVLQYTGGTTGVPKGAILTHANLMANVEQVRLLLEDSGLEGGRLLALLPLCHAFAMTSAMNLALASRSEIVLLPRLDMKQMLRTIETERPTLFPVVPALCVAMLSYPGVERFDLSSLRCCISGGAPLPTELKQRFEKRFGIPVVEGYGLTEASPVVTCNRLGEIGPPGSVGRPLARTEVDIRALDDPTRALPAGERGEVVVRGPQVMAGYWNHPEESREVLQGGWLRTGDVGHRDENGFLFLTGRIKEVILRSGYNVYPRTIEEALFCHSAVAEAAVIGIPDERCGEVPKAFVRLRDGEHVSEAELLAFVATRLNPLERPVTVEFRSELPKTVVGKVSGQELARQEAAKREERSGHG